MLKTQTFGRIRHIIFCRNNTFLNLCGRIKHKITPDEISYRVFQVLNDAYVRLVNDVSVQRL